MKKLILPLLVLLFLLSACSAQETAEHVIWQPSDPGQTAPAVETQALEASTEEVSSDDEVHDDGLEYAICPMDYFSITQTSGEGTHAQNFAIDFAGEDGGKEDFFAPFTLSIVRIQKGYNIVWAQSAEKVHLANGSLDYVNLLLEHCDNIDSLYEGMRVAQGEVFYSEGTAGNATGNHVHCEFSIGPYTDQGSHHSSDGRVSINNGVAANEIFFLTASTKCNDGQTDIGGFSWKTLPATKQELLDGWHCTGNGHLPQKLTVTREATCTQPGICTYTCRSCGITVSEEIPALGHTPEQVESFDAPRYVDHVTVFHCSVCDERWCEVSWVNAFDLTFPDVDEKNPAYNEISDVVHRKLMHTDKDGSFYPDAYISRATLLTLLYQKCGDTGAYSCSYDDVSDDDNIYPVVAWASAKGLAFATEGKKFTPECAVTRLDAIRMVLKYAELQQLLSTKISYNSAEEFAVISGLYSSADNLHAVMTRAEVAKLLSTVMSLAALEDS